MNQTGPKTLKKLEQRLSETDSSLLGPGDILRKIALFEGSGTYRVKTLFDTHLGLTLDAAHRYLNNLISTDGKKPKIITGLDYEMPIERNNVLYQTILEQIKKNPEFSNNGNLMYATEVFEDYLNSLDINSPFFRDVTGYFSIFDDSSIFGCSFRYKDSKKVIEKISLSLTLAKLLNEDPDFSQNKHLQIYFGDGKKITETSLIKKSLIKDFIGSRIVLRDENSVQQMLEKASYVNQQEGIKLITPNNEKREKFLRNQRSDGFKYFRRNKGENKYQSYHAHFTGTDMDLNFEMQFPHLLQFLRNEGDPNISHGAYDNVYSSLIDSLPEPAYENLEIFSQRLRNFYDNVKAIPIILPKN